jgi:hypothetical protein
MRHQTSSASTKNPALAGRFWLKIICITPPMLRCRDELLKAVRAVVRDNGRNEFTADEIVKRLQSWGSTFAEIRTHVTSRCCRNAAKNFVVTYEDFERIRPGIYRMI